MGLLTFIPVLLGAGLVRTVKGIKHLLTGKEAGGKEGKLGKDMRVEAKKMEKKWHEEVFQDFKGFGGSKAGPLDGLLKIVHMLVYVTCFPLFQTAISHLSSPTFILPTPDQLVNMFPKTNIPLRNHWCKLSPSAGPRAASILLELYFLDVKKQA